MTKKQVMIDEVDSDTFSGSIKFTFQLMTGKRMRMLLPQIFWTGISIAYWSGLAAIIIVRTIPNEDSSDQLIASLLALSVLGAGEMVGSLFMSQIVDRISNKAGVYTNVINMLFVWLFSYLMIRENQQGILIYTFTFSWGFMDGAVNTHTQQILGFEFDTSQDPFSVFTSVQAIGTVVF